MYVAKTELLSNNSVNDINIYLGNMNYDVKQSDNTYMEAGIYDSLKIVIGDGNGENWWSLIFPHSIDSLYSCSELLEQDEENKIEYSSGIIELFKTIFK